jgi:hypothetical protein
MNDRQQFTTEQLQVIDALIKAHAEAAREMARLMQPLRDAVRSRDPKAFKAAEATHKRSHERCKAARLALEIAREAFLRVNNAKSSKGG